MNACNAKIIRRDTKKVSEIENSLIKKYRKELWSQFIKGMKEYEMVKSGDKIAVCISGGKDSLLLAKLFQEYQKHVDSSISLEFIAMDPGFNADNKDLLQDTCKRLDIPIKICETKIFEVVDKIARNYPCYMCARMRRGALYSFAKENDCNKIALGHHFDDFIETILLNIFYAGKYEAMMPKLKAQNYEGVELIRPLVYVREDDIIKYNEYNLINNMNCGCTVAAKQTSSKRREIKETIKNLKKVNPEIEKAIFSSSKNVNLNTILGFKENGKKISFLETYNK